MDIEELRKRYLADLEQAGRPDPARAAPAMVADHLRSVERDDDALCAMISQIGNGNGTYDEDVQTVLDIARDSRLGTAPRLAALRQLGSAEFQPLDFAPFHAEYIELLRQLAQDPDRQVRASALDRLTLSNDPVAQQLLRDGLERKRRALVPAAKAVQLLARDDHAAGKALFRQLAQNGSQKVREQALIALAGDPGSGRLLETVAADKRERSAVRQAAAMSLKALSGKMFEKVAKALVLDEQNDDKLRAAAMTAMANSVVLTPSLATKRFSNQLEVVDLGTKSRALKSSIRRFERAVRSREGVPTRARNN